MFRLSRNLEKWRGVLITYFDKRVIRQIWEYQQLQEGKLLPSVDLIDCDTISISQEYQSAVDWQVRIHQACSQAPMVFRVI